MDILDIIWTVAIVALVAAPELIGKVAGKRKREAGEEAWPQIEPDGQDAPQDIDVEYVPQIPQTSALPKMPAPVVACDIKTTSAKPAMIAGKDSGQARRNIAEKQAAVMQETENLHRERIDPKKLIIYSAIMQPKFDEA